MPSSILPQNHDEQELYNAISSFFYKFHLGNLLRKCNAQKEKGVPVIQIFKYKLCNVFTDRSMYMQTENRLLQRNIFKKYFLSLYEQHENQLASLYNSTL